jgi:hypothetical protein
LEFGIDESRAVSLQQFAGGSVPSNLLSCGLLSNSSRWLGAPP